MISMLIEKMTSMVVLRPLVPPSIVRQNGSMMIDEAFELKHSN